MDSPKDKVKEEMEALQIGAAYRVRTGMFHPLVGLNLYYWTAMSTWFPRFFGMEASDLLLIT